MVPADVSDAKQPVFRPSGGPDIDVTVAPWEPSVAMSQPQDRTPRRSARREIRISVCKTTDYPTHTDPTSIMQHTSNKRARVPDPPRAPQPENHSRGTLWRRAHRAQHAHQTANSARDRFAPSPPTPTSTSSTSLALHDGMQVALQLLDAPMQCPAKEGTAQVRLCMRGWSARAGEAARAGAPLFEQFYDLLRSASARSSRSSATRLVAWTRLAAG